MQTNLKDALKNADSIKSPMGDVACYSMNFAELASEINVHLENNKKPLLSGFSLSINRSIPILNLNRF